MDADRLTEGAVLQEVARASAVVVVFQTQECDVGAGNSACSFLSQDINTTASVRPRRTSCGA